MDPLPHGAAAAAAADPDSDSESCVFDAELNIGHEIRNGESVRSRFVAGLGSMASRIEVVSIRMHTFPTLIARARISSFQIYARVTGHTRGGNANVKYAWYPASGMDEIMGIILHGFGHDHIHGLRLFPEDYPIRCVERSMARSVPDGDGLRHLLLCRVLLGRMKVVPPAGAGSDQCNLISDEYDSGVDNVASPKEYFIWSNRMNTHVLPDYVLSFRVPLPPTPTFSIGPPRNVVNAAADAAGTERPKSPSIPFSYLIKGLSRLLPSPDVAFIAKSFQEHGENVISREVLLQRVKVIVGDRLLADMIKSFHAWNSKRQAPEGGM